MNDTSVDAQAPPKQARTLGKCRTSDGIDLRLREENGEVFLIRPSVGSRRDTEEDIAAWVTVVHGHVTNIRWNEWHQNTRPAYMPEVDAWIRRRINGDTS
jgi:hypothetical protein